MCGICGFVGPPPSPDLAAVQAMCEVLEHRGPDGQGEMAIRSRERGRELEGWLGHRRLKIIDLTEAAGQPMANESGDVVLTYNGEVYNFRELRSSLEAAGHRFRSTGDTEVVLRAYEEWGEDFVRQLDGMFALAIWDGPRGRLVLARDRTGKKPLYYTELGGRLAFASEIKALLSAPWIPARADLTKLPEYLTFGYVPHPATFYEGIVQVPPAATVVYDADGVHGPYPYWDALPAPDQVDTGEGTDAVVRLLRDATTSRLVSDVPLGALLSGGIDSSIVVGLMAEAAAEPVHTFSIGFPDEPSFDERPYARRVAEHFGTRHTGFAVKAAAVGLLGELLWHHDQPFADSSAIPTYLVSGLAREHVTIVLNGDGGDEVFGGYDRFVAAKMSGLIPPRFAAVARRGTRILPRSHGYYSVRRRADRFLERGERPLRDRYQSWIAVMNEELLSETLARAGRAHGDMSSVTSSMDAYYARAAGAPPLDQILYANFKTYLP